MWHTAEEYLVDHGQPISMALKESVTEADYSTVLGENVRFAMPATFGIEGKSHAGVIVVTTHRLICCSSVRHNLVNATMPFSQSIGIGDESGLLLKQIPIVCDDVSVLIRASSDHIKKLRNALLDAIEAAPNQKDLGFCSAAIFRQSAEDHRRIQKIKAAHAGERRTKK